MKKYDFKPLIMILPLFLIIGILIKIDHPLNVLDKIVVNTTNGGEKSTENTIQIAESGTEEATSVDVSTEENGLSTSNDVPINPIIPNYQRVIPDDAEKILIAIGTKGSMEIGGGDYIYEEPDEESEQLALLEFHCAVICYENQYDEDWVHIKLIGEDTEGYIKSESVYIMELAIGDSDPIRNEIVKNAYSYLGLRFKTKGSSLTEGIDCSNFVQKIYGLSGIEIPDRPTEQFEYGVQINDADALPGDLVYYDKANNGTGHVGIYLGDGMMIHSSGHSGKTYPTGGVRISCLLYPDRDHYIMVNLLNQDSGKMNSAREVGDGDE